MTLHVAIIGAGISGLVAAKQCLDEGLVPTVFESRNRIGGQWAYEEPDPETGEAHSAVYPGVISNSCRDTSNFSDFPIDPSRYPDYYGHELFLRYIQGYADHFGLESYVRFNSKVKLCQQLYDGRWQVTYTEHGAGPVDESYDALFICTGRNANPNIPTFNGMENFRGSILHSHVYRRPDVYSGLKVAVVGFGPSAVDISSEICGQAKECHLITRRGGWVVPRYSLGQPIEATQSRFSQSLLPTSVAQWILTHLYHFVVGEIPAAIHPDHGILEANPVIRSDFLENVKTGRITAHRAEIERITPTGLLMNNGKMLELDAIILCTGYRIDYPFISGECYRAQRSEFVDSPNSVHLYRLTVPPHYPNLFFLGLYELLGPIHPAVELQARWATAVLVGRIKLPSAEQMDKSIAEFEKQQAERWVRSDRHALSADMLPYCDSLARDLGVEPTFCRLVSRIFSSNPRSAMSVLHYVYFGMVTGAQYRLFGHGSKPELAAATILRLARKEGKLSEAEQAALRADLVHELNARRPPPRH
ncbi:hypothetical protein VTN77DRAFT_3463 [Rasamsonia byssochlamydoides]|uniref:uncharacterized protein n=1 Tax=Rasamsonia byssochlamydoides TaxID=89139 RepID=UPI0037447A9A